MRTEIANQVEQMALADDSLDNCIGEVLRLETVLEREREQHTSRRAAIAATALGALRQLRMCIRTRGRERTHNPNCVGPPRIPCYGMHLRRCLLRYQCIT